MHLSNLKMITVALVTLYIIAQSHVEAIRGTRTFRFDSQDQSNKSDIIVFIDSVTQEKAAIQLLLSYPEQKHALNLTTFNDFSGTKMNSTSLYNDSKTTYVLNITKATEEEACYDFQYKIICQFIIESDDQPITFFVLFNMYAINIYGMNPVTNLTKRSPIISQKLNQEFLDLRATHFGISFTGDQDTIASIRTVTWDKDSDTRAAALPKNEPFKLFYQCSTYTKLEEGKKEMNATSFLFDYEATELDYSKEDKCNVTFFWMDSLDNSFYAFHFKNQLEIHPQGFGTIVMALLIFVGLVAVLALAMWFFTEKLGGKTTYKVDQEDPNRWESLQKTLGDK